MHLNYTSTSFTRSISLLSAAAIMAGCASASKDIVSASVSPLQYQNYTCEQLISENARIQNKAIELGARLDQSAQNDKAITGVALLLFWPAAFALGGNKAQEAEYARLKGENDAIQQTLVMRNCGMRAGVPVPAAAPATALEAQTATTATLVTAPAAATVVSAAQAATAVTPAAPAQRKLVGTTFVFADTDPLNGSSAGNQRMVVTHQDATIIEFNNGEYVTDQDGNRKSGRYAINGTGLYRRGALPGQTWSAEVTSADGQSTAKLTVSALGLHDIALPSGLSHPTLRISVDGYANGPARGTNVQMNTSEKITGTITMDVATGLPLEYSFNTRNNSFSVNRKLERIQ